VSPFKFDPGSGTIPVGEHDVEIVEATAGVNSRGNDNLRVVYEAPSGAQIADWLVHVPQSRWRWRQVWEAAGLPFPNGGEVDESELVGRRVHIDVVEDSYQGQTRPRVGEVSEYLGSDIPADEPEVPAGVDGSFAAAAGLEDDEEAPY
jgi:hypothetical protein